MAVPRAGGLRSVLPEGLRGVRVLLYSATRRENIGGRQKQWMSIITTKTESKCN